MPKGYVIFTEAIHDHAGLDAYGQKSFPTMMQSGGIGGIESPDVASAADGATIIIQSTGAVPCHQR